MIHDLYKNLLKIINDNFHLPCIFLKVRVNSISKATVKSGSGCLINAENKFNHIYWE